MKNLSFVVLAAFGVVANVSAQGTLYFGNYINGILLAPIFAPDPGNPSSEQHGQSELGIQQGTSIYNGPLLAGSGYSVALYAGPYGSSADSLHLAATSTFLSSTDGSLPAGLWLPSVVTIPGVLAGSSVTVDIRVWDNRGGTVTSWEAALQDPTVARGSSGAFSPLGLLGGSPQFPVNSPLFLMGLKSFNIAVQVPEPAVFALLAVAGILLYRRKFS
jgi:hypothetical protein